MSSTKGFVEDPLDVFNQSLIYGTPPCSFTDIKFPGDFLLCQIVSDLSLRQRMRIQSAVALKTPPISEIKVSGLVLLVIKAFNFA